MVSVLLWIKWGSLKMRKKAPGSVLRVVKWSWGGPGTYWLRIDSITAVRLGSLIGSKEPGVSLTLCLGWCARAKSIIHHHWCGVRARSHHYVSQQAAEAASQPQRGGQHPRPFDSRVPLEKGPIYPCPSHIPLHQSVESVKQAGNFQILRISDITVCQWYVIWDEHKMF